MSDSFLEQLTERVARRSQEPIEDAEATDDYGTFGLLRGVRDRALYLELRRKDGSMHAPGYSWLEGVSFNPSEGLTLKFTGQTIRIRGRNLNAECRPNVTLINGILRHKVPWIQEADHARSVALWTDKRATVIESIEW